MGNLAFLKDELAALQGELRPGGGERLAEVRQALSEASLGAERVRDVVRGLKDFSRPDEDRQEPTDVAEVMRLMRAKGVRRVPVLTHSGALAGILAIDDLLEPAFANGSAGRGVATRQSAK